MVYGFAWFELSNKLIPMPVPIGFTRFGDGPIRVIVLHDWFCDHSSWDAALPYLTPERFSYVFADLRGYGASQNIEGACTLDEATSDVIALADHLAWDRFSLIGHSMSGLIVQRLAQVVPGRIARVVAITPLSPGGMKVDEGMREFLRALALAGDEQRFTMISTFWGTRLSETWIRFKLRLWRATTLIVAAAQDAPPFQAAALEASMLSYYPNAQIMSFAGSGHYPVQEQPPMLTTAIERFLSAAAPTTQGAVTPLEEPETPES